MKNYKMPEKEVFPVKNKKELNEFIKFPFQVYRNDPHWIPPLLSEQKFIFSNKNPFWEHAERTLFLVKEEKKVLGRIAATIDSSHINFHQEKCGFFGFFECVEDYPVAERLLNAARDWLKEKGMEIMRGPMNPSMNEECGFLIEGFDSSPTLMMTYNPPYYLEFMERYGLQKAKDLFAYLAPVTGEQLERLNRLAEMVKKREPNLSVHAGDLKNFRQELENIKRVYNSAWSENWGFVPLTDKEIEVMAEKLKPLIVPEIIQIALLDGKPAGFLMAFPDYNQVLKKINGKLNLIGVIKFLWFKRKINTVRLMTMGICPEYRKRGVDVLLYLESLKGTQKKGYKFAEYSWVLEDNLLTQRAAEMMGGKLYKKYRIYEMSI